MPISRRLNRECPCEAKGDSASILFASSLNYSCAHVWAREDFWPLAGLWIIFMHCAAHDLEATLGTSLLCSDVRLEYQSEGRPGVILGSPCFLFSESTGLEFHTCIIL